MTITILIPAHNEEKSIRATINSCLQQTRPADEIMVVNDGSTDKTAEILASFGDKIKVITIAVATGNKSHAQEYGLRFVTTEFFASTDGDTILDEHFIERALSNFENKKIDAVVGYVRSMKYNWLTACRAFEYVIGQNIYKLAQSYIDYIVVIPGAAGAFRTETFKKYITFDHDTITEDLDFTYCFHKNNLLMSYDREMIVYTQDPMTVSAYANQLRRWYGGGWQNLLKHRSVITHRFNSALELSLVYSECLIFALVIFLLPFINLNSYKFFIVSYFVLASVLSLYAAVKEKRQDMVFVPFTYFFIMYVNSYLFLEQMVKEVILRKKNLYWFTPERTNM
ncbi:MAG: glycosyltransferase family 2 protein [Candidatus Paceibacterota bacterium]|jgi:cellulose synthase/poly-beta-1,6-N-acetylglucosamine synthase-like glycosyltransferase|nr:glycosyltransferase family 2 protein [Candidatus Paceibacterota bacterium]